jgi:hypothetical protein
MYPGPDLLQEVGRVTIAGSRLDVQMGMLWHHLDRNVTLEDSRRAPAAEQCKRVRRLAAERLTGDMLEQVVAAVAAVESARIRRNEIVHQDWLLRGARGHAISELAEIAPEDLPAYLEEWERESRASQNWQRVPSRSVDVVPAQNLDDLREVERELAAATDLVSALTFRVASSRETAAARAATSTRAEACGHFHRGVRPRSPWPRTARSSSSRASGSTRETGVHR